MLQFYAHDLNKNLVLAANAIKHFNYSCPDCQSTVRLRQGAFRKPHFYHLNSGCSSGKSLAHLRIQEEIIKQIPRGEAKMEVPFPTISRIADITWDRHRLIFEVQCSKTSTQEIISRNEDYAKAGYLVIWILHTEAFPLSKSSAVRTCLLTHPHYYTSFEVEDPHLTIFDHHLPLGTTNIRIEKPRLKWPKVLAASNLNLRHALWPLRFSGDWLRPFSSWKWLAKFRQSLKR